MPVSLNGQKTIEDTPALKSLFEAAVHGYIDFLSELEKVNNGHRHAVNIAPCLNEESKVDDETPVFFMIHGGQVCESELVNFLSSEFAQMLNPEEETVSVLEVELKNLNKMVEGYHALLPKLENGMS